MPSKNFQRFDAGRDPGMAGEMAYMTDRRGDMRGDPRRLLPEAQSIVCIGKLYNSAPHNLPVSKPVASRHPDVAIERPRIRTPQDF